MQMSSIVKGAAVGIAAGCTTCALSNAKRHKRHMTSRSNRKKAERALKTVGNVMDDIAQMMK